jgi:DNA-binding response OmpR family regulator
MPHQRVLIADDDPSIRQLLEMTLCGGGYEVISAIDGYELVRLAQECTPSLILVDLMMPRMNGYEAIRQMRNDTRTSHIPMLILTALSESKDIVVGFDHGADDYIAKPFDIPELLARVKSHLRRATQRPVLNPLTGLPGGMLLTQELRHRLSKSEPFALLYADMDNFKAFNDTYGFSRGDQAIIFVAHLLQSILAAHGNPSDFIGHIGGDDFAFLTTSDRVDQICHALIDAFDREVPKIYDPDDRQRGYISGTDRYGILRRFGLMSISIGVVNSQRRGFCDEEALTRVAAEMKHYAKEQPGSSYAVDQRAETHGSSVERRGMRSRGVLVASSDASLRTVLLSTFHDNDYIVHQAASVAALRQMIGVEHGPALILADAQLGEPLWALCAERATAQQGPKIVVLAYEEADVQRAHAVGVEDCLRQPLPLVDIVACVERLASSGSLSDDTRTVGGS